MKNLKFLLTELREQKWEHFVNSHPQSYMENGVEIPHVTTFYPVNKCQFCSKIFKQIDQTVLVLLNSKQYIKTFG